MSLKYRIEQPFSAHESPKVFETKVFLQLEELRRREGTLFGKVTFHLLKDSALTIHQADVDILGARAG
jgi:hypothetical protein